MKTICWNDLAKCQNFARHCTLSNNKLLLKNLL